jgi:RNA polymerase sigma factor (sigma-70 family)
MEVCSGGRSIFHGLSPAWDFDGINGMLFRTFLVRWRIAVEWVTTSTVLDKLGDFKNRTVWDLFVARFRLPIVSFARKMGLAEQDAEDVAQQTLLDFARAFRAGCYDRSRGRLNKWLFGIAYRRVLKAREQFARRERQVAPDADGTSFWATIPEERPATTFWDSAWRRAMLQQCLDGVRCEVQPSTYRAFEMVTFERRSPADAAAELGLTRNAVFIAKHRVATRLRELRREYEEVI